MITIFNSTLRVEGKKRRIMRRQSAQLTKRYGSEGSSTGLADGFNFLIIEDKSAGEDNGSAVRLTDKRILCKTTSALRD